MNTALHKASLTRLPMRAALSVALICAVILGFSGLREWSSRAEVLKTAEVELGNLARSLTQHAEDSFDLMDASILGLVLTLQNDGINAQTLSRLRKIMIARKASLKRVHGLLVTDESGDWLASSGAMGGNLSEREYFRHHLQSTSRDPFIGRPVKSITNGDWISTVSRRFSHPDGRFAGVVVATIGAGYFAEFYRQFDIGASGTLSLLSADGITRARIPDDGSNVGRDVSDGPFFRGTHSAASSGVYSFRSALDGLQRLSFYQRSERYPFILLATKAQDELLAPWRRAAITRMLFVLGLVVLIAVMGLYLVRQLLQGQRMAAALAAKESNFRLLAEGSSDMVTRIGLDERIEYASPSSIRIVGWRPDQLVGTPALAGVNPLDLPRVEETVAALRSGEAEEARIAYRSRHREKSEVWLESTLRVTRKISGEIDGVVAISRDMTEQKDMEEKLATLAIEDGLTGLANRRRFDERLLEEWGRAYRERSCLALLMIDLDHFKAYNDTYGHPAGDECLRSVARVLAAEALRATDLVARFGGEEFVMLLPNTDAAGCARIGERVRRAVREAAIPHTSNLPSGLVTASVGGAICRPCIERSASHVTLLEAADQALYAAKDGGRDRLVMARETVSLLPLALAAR